MTIESSISPAAPGTYRLTNSAIVAGAKVECQVNGVVWLRKQPENEIAKPSPAVAIAVAERKLMLVVLLPQKKTITQTGRDAYSCAEHSRCRPIPRNRC